MSPQEQSPAEESCYRPDSMRCKGGRNPLQAFQRNKGTLSAELWESTSREPARRIPKDNAGTDSAVVVMRACESRQERRAEPD